MSVHRVILLVLCIVGVCVLPSASADTRMEAVDRALDAYQAKDGGSACWDEICTIDEAGPIEVETDPVVVGAHPKSHAKVRRVARTQNSLMPKETWEVGAEWFDYTYREEGLMKLDGSMAGAYAAYTYRFHMNKPNDALNILDRINLFKVDMRYGRGTDIKYRSEGTGEHENETHSSYEVRGVLGADYPLHGGTVITPYGGFGYRYLYDDNGGELTTTNNWGYDRESRYYYAPLGVDIARRLKGSWHVVWNAEYDYFIDGRQESHFEDDPNGVYSQTLVNDQSSGYGLRSSFKFVRETGPVDIVFEPFVRYWHIEDSNTACTVDTCGLEPNNRTQEYGMKIGVQF